MLILFVDPHYKEPSEAHLMDVSKGKYIRGFMLKGSQDEQRYT